MAIAWCPVIAGCSYGPPRAAVKGEVTLDGRPLRQGVIRFVPLDDGAGPKYSLPISNGEFAAPASAGPAAGRHTIEIDSTDNGGYAPDDEEAIAKLKAARKRIKVVRVPRRYNKQSELTADLLVSGVNELNFKLETNP